ncbi:PKS-ER domain-containing protein [Fusarium sp. LHS14.1]|nr:PKS-ER domain-containing protein [Fusarium sp. LHS14.1]
MTEVVQNKTWVFKQPPTGLPQPGINTVFEDRPLKLVPPPRGLVIKLLTSGLDPHQRDRMRGSGNVDYVPGYENGEPITNFSIAKVIRSDNEAFEEGCLIAGSLPIAEYGIIPKELIDARAMASPLVWKVSNDYNLDVKHYVGSLGLAGMTAWNSFYGLVKPVKGETIWVNAASSSVGEVVVQLAKIEGMKVIASVSSDDKLDYVVNELGADVGFNYRKEPVNEALKRLAPEGLDVVFENVGGDHFQAAVENMKWFGRIISCGTASQYNKPIEEQYGVTNLSEIFRRRIKIQGFIFWDDNIYTDNIDSFRATMPKWVAEGKIKSRYTDFEGIEQADKAFLSMFTGRSFGKTVLKISDP